MECSILNIHECFIEAIGNWILEIINAPLQLLLNIIKDLLTLPANIDAFSSLWAVMISLISIFYGILIIAAGINLMTSGGSAERRENAKSWLQNILLMIVLVQASYLMYSLAADISAGLTQGVFGLINTDFFLINFEFTDIALAISLEGVYLITMFTTTLLLTVNYLFASIGVLFCPIGIFLYFIPALRDIGKFILTMNVLVLVIPFFTSLIILATSMISQVNGYFSSIHIIFAIASFHLINTLFILLSILAVVRSVMTVLRTDIAKGVIMIKGGAMLSKALKK